MTLAAILAVCDDCPSQQEWEGGAVTCREMRGPDGRPMRPCRFRAYAQQHGSACPLGKWQQDVRQHQIAMPAKYRVGHQMVEGLALI